ncbi:DUF2071 domain-containing protein [Algisphaera agarilytica]|uniref:Acetoacetate decarboxylase n=1 Tax=Algisphaera agarilytica TaxID=1385975 RepID=A0A7X0H688_9BACT|nr:DUF2071 domain-containing protein [Algisphaera agarilytica]MBB6430047.1 hypothetical protein [Algisphaera agarilytica]
MNLTMTGRLTDCVLLSYRTPAETVAGLIPEGLELVTRGPWAFWNIVACRVEGMRPAFPGAVDAPAALGVTYHHVAYRLLVQAMTDRADVRKGLYFVRSDADARVLGAVGNWTTDFKFHAAEMALAAEPDTYTLGVRTADGRADATLRLDGRPPRLEMGSCFPTLQDAQEFLKYQPYALAVTGREGRRRLRIAEVQRDEAAWAETPVSVDVAEFGLFEEFGQSEHVRFELATRVAAMDYTWKLGRTEGLLGQAVEQPADAEAEVAQSA